MIACLDLEGVLLPEIWIKFAEKVRVDGLKKTTRDIPDYNELMAMRIELLNENKFKLRDIQAVIRTLEPLEGAKDFLYWVKSEFEVIILSDTFYEFSAPLMQQLEYPTLFCHHLIVDNNGTIKDFRLRQEDQKSKAVKALQSLNFRVVAGGDSYNDIGMLKQADKGILFCPPENIIKEFRHYPVAKNYNEFKVLLKSIKNSFNL